MKPLKLYTSAGILMLINGMFLAKYLSRVTEAYLIFAIAGSALFTWLLFNLNRFDAISSLSRVALLIGYLGFCGVAFDLIAIETLNVDRWSVIQSFLDAFFNGDYVYFAQSFDGNYPGPMPFYFVLAAPFYFIGEYGFFSLLFLPAFALCLHLAGHRWNDVVLLYLMIFPPVIYDVVVRSNLVFNASLILMLMVLVTREIESGSRQKMMVAASLIGLSLSMRSVMVIPYIILFLYLLRKDFIGIKDVVRIGLVAASVFVMTFVPFVVGHFDEFLSMNPFIIQSDVLIPFEFSVACILLAALAGWLAKGFLDVIFYSGALLFLTIVIHFGYKTFTENFDAAFFDSRADISYLLFSVPFLVYYCAAMLRRHDKEVA